ncbi:MAG: DUF2892 domain-containing protein [Gammaproteobacteria bacterium]|nr:DUF2892 domain-containing protein [Gammaproteobacteria bacterium]
MKKRRIHDGVAGGLISLGVILGYYLNLLWLLLPVIIGLLMLQSAFSKFCPVYYTLDKIFPTLSE